MDHERFIDRGIPTGADGAPVDALRDIVFGSPTDNITTLEATVLRGTLTRKYADTMTGVFNLHYGDYEKMYQNLYASGYSAANQTVTLDGYRDPTERTHMVLNGHVTNQFSAGGMDHSLLIGGEYIDTESENLRYNTQWSTSGNDKETFDGDFQTDDDERKLAIFAQFDDFKLLAERHAPHRLTSTQILIAEPRQKSRSRRCLSKTRLR